MNLNKIIVCFMAVCFLTTCSKKNDANPSATGIIEEINRNTNSEKIVTVGTAKYVTGYTQTSGNNQDAYALKEVDGQVVWSKYYDRSPDDSRGLALATDGDDLFVAFYCTGGNSDFKATTGAFQSSYGSGGGAAIVYFARINAQTGELLKATFIGCKLSDGKTNTLRPKDNNVTPIKILGNQRVEFSATKAYDIGDGRLTPNLGPDVDCNKSGGGWIGVFDYNMALLSGDCTQN